MSDTEAFVQLFAERWREVDPDHFKDMFHPEGQFRHPGREQPITRDENAAYWMQVKSLIPDLRLEPTTWAAKESILFIEWNASGTFRGKRLQWSGVTRFTLRDGLAVEGVAHFDTLPLWAAIDPTMSRGNLLRAAEEPGTDQP